MKNLEMEMLADLFLVEAIQRSNDVNFGKLILVFIQNGYPENDAGTHIEYPNSIEEMDKRCNELLKNGRHGDKCVIVCAGELQREFKYEPIEKVTIYERRQI